MIEVKNLKTPNGCSAFGFWSFAHDGGSICDINNDDCGFDRSLDSCPAVESYIKSKLVATLTEIQLEIEEIKPLKPTDDEDWQYGCFHGLKLMQDKCLKLVQQKINSLKEKNDNNNA